MGKFTLGMCGNGARGMKHKSRRMSQYEGVATSHHATRFTTGCNLKHPPIDWILGHWIA